MARHWATETVRAVPVFGERGALLEWWVFCLFYNWPLTIGRRVRKRIETRKTIKPRFWHMLPCSLAAAGVAAAVAYPHIRETGALPALKEIWWFMALMPLLYGAIVTLGAGGASIRQRIIAAVGCGALTGVLSTVFLAVLASRLGSPPAAGPLITHGIWQVFVFAVLSPLGAGLTELKIPDPDLKPG
jgi:FtsH-binding integral membrane protein